MCSNNPSKVPYKYTEYIYIIFGLSCLVLPSIGGLWHILVVPCALMVCRHVSTIATIHV